MKQSEWKSIEDTFDRMLKLVSSENFLKMQGLGNEIPFFICPYPATEAVAVASMQKNLVNSLAKKGIRVLEINLYDLVIDLLKAHGDWEYYRENEPTMQKQKLKEDLQSILDVETVLVPAIVERMELAPFDVLFLAGVGEVFPYIRSHNILNNMQSKAKTKPTVMFFPGAYTYSLESGASLVLFDKLHDDKYYRAFNVFHCEV